jgi:hypothetical protein
MQYSWCTPPYSDLPLNRKVFIQKEMGMRLTDQSSYQHSTEQLKASAYFILGGNNVVFAS